MKKITLLFSVLILAGALTGCGVRGVSVGVSTDYPAAIMSGGEIYLLTQEALAGDVDESAVIGYTDYTDGFPEKDGQANFCRMSLPYAAAEGGIAVLYENEWRLCTPKQ